MFSLHKYPSEGKERIFSVKFWTNIRIVTVFHLVPPVIHNLIHTFPQGYPQGVQKKRTIVTIVTFTKHVSDMPKPNVA